LAGRTATFAGQLQTRTKNNIVSCHVQTGIQGIKGSSISIPVACIG